MKIIIEDIFHKNQRYDTAGDWIYDEQCSILHIYVSHLADPREMALIAIHELIEAILCIHEDIGSELVDKFDMNYKGPGEPGDDINAPYYHQHQIATGVERIVASLLGVSWNLYDQHIKELNL